MKGNLNLISIYLTMLMKNLENNCWMHKKKKIRKNYNLCRLCHLCYHPLIPKKVARRMIRNNKKRNKQENQERMTHLQVN